MSFKKPFRAVPIEVGAHYRHKRQRKENSRSVAVLAGAAIIGGTIGVSSLALDAETFAEATAEVQSFAAFDGAASTTVTGVGAYYRHCDAARAAGAAPLRRGEAGYRPALDRDGDGVACEPYFGR
jgi:uncharacterized membrane protein YfcA